MQPTSRQCSFLEPSEGKHDPKVQGPPSSILPSHSIGNDGKPRTSRGESSLQGATRERHSNKSCCRARSEIRRIRCRGPRRSEGWGATGASGISDHTEVGAKSQDASGEASRSG
ncbi:hypothetical protein OG21DRAFT_1053494 [Imleria badia]|nr:hypothetical protein OG21DRAFT_1053494 [Imleria badia]